MLLKLANTKNPGHDRIVIHNTLVVPNSNKKEGNTIGATDAPS